MAINIFPIKSSLIILCTIFITTFLHLISPSHCLHPPHKHPLYSTRGLLFGEKTRLGSTPPSCHNKCNQCHPCMAVQVPTLLSHNGVQPGMSRPGATTPLDYYESSPSSAAGNRYSNYKPLGWKCRCKNNFYNP